MLNVGLTGGLATGKSTVGRMLADLGCYLIQMDQLGHRVLEPGGEAYAGVAEHFGAEVLQPDGSIHRGRLAQLVFANPNELAYLNSLVHPPVRARAKTLARGFLASHPDGIAVTEAAILIETGSYREYDRLLVAVCPRSLQIERAMARPGASGDDVLQRLNSQMRIEEKVKFADYVIDTSGSMEDTRSQVLDVHEALVEIARARQADSSAVD